jgi:uncharacterized protein YukE
MPMTVSQILGAQPGAVVDAADTVSMSANAADFYIGGQRRSLSDLDESWNGAASEAAGTQGAVLVSQQEAYRAKLIAIQQALSSGGTQLVELRSQLHSIVTGDVSRWWMIGDDGSVFPGALLQEYASFSPAAELEVTLMAMQLSVQIRLLLAQFELADSQTAQALRTLAD